MRLARYFQVIVLTAFVAGGVVYGQNRDVAIYTKTDVRDVVERVERHSDEFRKHFEKSLDKSALNGTDREDRLRRWTQDLEDMADHLKSDQKKGEVRDMEQRANTLLALAAGINRIMLYRSFNAETDRDWRLVRTDLNALAIAYDLPTLQNYRVRDYTSNQR